MAGVLYRLGRLCANRAIVVVAVWLGLVVLVRLAVWGVGAETSNDLSLPGTEGQQATDLLASRFPPQQNGSSPVVFHATKGKITDSANKQAVEASSKALAKAPHVASAPDPFANAASGLVSEDATTAFTPVLLDIPNGDVTEELAGDLRRQALSLGRQAAQLARQAAALARQAARLARQAAPLLRQDRALTAQAAALQRQADALQQQADDLAALGGRLGQDAAEVAARADLDARFPGGLGGVEDVAGQLLGDVAVGDVQQHRGEGGGSVLADQARGRVGERVGRRGDARRLGQRLV